jgi:hypothetical protein
MTFQAHHALVSPQRPLLKPPALKHQKLRHRPLIPAPSHNGATPCATCHCTHLHPLQQQVENGNYVIDVARTMSLTVVNVGGLDIVDGEIC